jgi:hypothetical protein
MTFAKPESNNHQEKQQKLLCSKCLLLTNYDDLANYGSFCKACYDVYCYDAPAYPQELNKYLGDPKGWAKRIVDKHNIGIPVARISLEFAQQALS